MILLLTFAAIALSNLSSLHQRINCLPFSPCSSEQMQMVVGSVQGKCCQPGRRWGCAPRNFEQSGCVPILGAAIRCTSRDWTVVRCSPANCTKTNPEHSCEVDIRRVAQNRCRPTGNRTTVGCPDEQWQCEILKKDYTERHSPTVDVLVCDLELSTPCGAKYSHCD